MIDLETVRIVLVEPSHPGNIGASARAMKTMGLTQLYLVSPRCYPHAEASARASGADDVLKKAVVCRDLDEALSGVNLVLGTSARARNLEWPTIPPRQAASAIESEPESQVAFIFGRERSGLTNTELERCHYRVHIPSNPQYSSLNLAAAVQLICYELSMVTNNALSEGRNLEPHFPSSREREVYADQMEVERFFIHLEQALEEIDFLDPDNPRQLMRRLKRLFNRTRLFHTEVNLLRGILTAAQRQARLARDR